MTGRHNVHGTGIVLDGAGLMLRGPSGAGKSLLALALLDQWEARGREASLVADDRIDLDVTDDGIVMHAPPRIAGMIELRGRGIIRRPYTDGVRLDLVVDLVPTLERMPEAAAFTTELYGRALPCCPVPHAGIVGLGHQLLLVSEALRGFAHSPPRLR